MNKFKPSLNKEQKNSYILEKNINNKYKLVPLFLKENKVGSTKYFPASSKEWTNNVYTFLKSKTKNFPVYDINLNDLIKSYFNLYFNYKFIKSKLKSRRSKRISLNKIFVSKPEIKHTNNKAIITIYTYNKERLSLINKIRNLKKNFYKKVFFFLYKSKKFFYNFIFKLTNNKIVYFELYKKFIESLLIKELILIRRYKLRFNLNRYKFEEIFLYKLNKLIYELYGKKIEINIINLKSIMFNSHLFTEILGLRIKKKNANVMRNINIILNKAKLPKVNRIIEKSRLVKSVNSNLLENKYKNLNLNFLLKDNNLNEKLNDLYYNVSTNMSNNAKLFDIIFNDIKYKNIGGVRLEIKGRLTKRYRADRALFKVKWKGGLKNIDSSYKGLSSVNMRGYLNSNVEYSIFTSKRRIGAFAVKGWVSGK